MNKSTLALQSKTENFLQPSQGILQRKCACGQHTPSGGKCAACSDKEKLKKPLQTKLQIGEANDKYEQQAERVADQVMRMTAPPNGGSNSDLQSSFIIQRRIASTQNDATEVPSIVGDVLHSSGQPLDTYTRDSMGRQFGHDFSQVRVHVDAGAAESAKAVNALAYTVGRHVVFNTGRYAPRNSNGRRLLAHELTHVVQQRNDQKVMQRFEESTEPNSRWGEHLKDVGTVLGGPGMGILRGALAAACLSDLERPMGSITSERWIPNACARSASGILHSREWDAFGHCWVACEGSRQCGETPTEYAGTGREIYREIEDAFGGNPHDSLLQDLNNQALGRELSFTAGTCFSLCDHAHTSGSLDLSAPIRVCADCATYPAPESRGPCP